MNAGLVLVLVAILGGVLFGALIGVHIERQRSRRMLDQPPCWRCRGDGTEPAEHRRKDR